MDTTCERIDTIDTIDTYVLKYYTCCDVSHKEGERVYSGIVPVKALINMSAQYNTRCDKGSEECKGKFQPTQSRKAIKKSLLNEPENFHLYHGGIKIIAKDIKFDPENSQVVLFDSGMPDGGQSVGVFREIQKSGENLHVLSAGVCVTIFVVTDKNKINKMSSGHNFRDPVNALSHAGKRGAFDDMETRFRGKYPHLRLKKSETDVGDQYVDTAWLLQIMCALMPKAIYVVARIANMADPSERKSDIKMSSVGKDYPCKSYFYGSKQKAINAIARAYEIVYNEPDHIFHDQYAMLYNYFKDMIIPAYELWLRWSQQKEFRGVRKKTFGIMRNKKGEIVGIAKGTLYPILAAHSLFVDRMNGQWALEVPTYLNEADIVELAIQSYEQSKTYDADIIGKNSGVYGLVSMCMKQKIYEREREE